MKALYYCLLICFLTILSVMNAFADGRCYYSINNDTLKIGNLLIERQWIWKNGNLYPVGIINKNHPQKYLITSDEYIQRLHNIPEETSIQHKNVDATSISHEKLEVEIFSAFKGYDKKIVISLVESSPAFRMRIRRKN